MYTFKEDVSVLTELGGSTVEFYDSEAEADKAFRARNNPNDVVQHYKAGDISGLGELDGAVVAKLLEEGKITVTE